MRFKGLERAVYKGFNRSSQKRLPARGQTEQKGKQESAIAQV